MVTERLLKQLNIHFKECARIRHNTSEFHEMDNSTLSLDSFLRLFYAELKNLHGEDYSRCTVVCNVWFHTVLFWCRRGREGLTSCRFQAIEVSNTTTVGHPHHSLNAAAMFSRKLLVMKLVIFIPIQQPNEGVSYYSHEVFKCLDRKFFQTKRTC